MKHKGRILIIEDARTINRIIRKELEKLGFAINQAYSFNEAGKALAKRSYDLIILDLHLPDGEGSELIAQIQSLTRTKVIVLTARNDDELREELFEYGIVDYIVKDSSLIYSIYETIRVIEHIITKKSESILVVDDSLFIRRQIKTILEPRNYRVESAANGSEALKKICKRVYDLIILDMELPDIHGLQLLERIRKDVRYFRIPIIVLSGTSNGQIVREILKNGANDYIRKPFVAEEFVLRIDLWIDYFKKIHTLEKQRRQLRDLNKNLEKRVAEEVQKSRLKDEIVMRKERLAQMGEMIGMIAHQWRQPLNNLFLSCQLLVSKYKSGQLDDAAIDRFKESTKKYINYMSKTIDDFMNFFKPEEVSRSFDILQTTRETVELLRENFDRSGIKIELISQAKNVKIEGYPDALMQVLINLLFNAKDALTAKREKDRYIRITLKENEDQIEIHVQDNGGGVPEALIDKVFDPYFSTKREKNGTGLGLYMSKTLVEEQMRGSLKLFNDKDGAHFIILLPKTLDFLQNAKGSIA